MIGDDNISELGVEKAMRFVRTLCNLPVLIEVEYLRLDFAGHLYLLIWSS